MVERMFQTKTKNDVDIIGVYKVEYSKSGVRKSCI